MLGRGGDEAAKERYIIIMRKICHPMPRLKPGGCRSLPLQLLCLYIYIFSGALLLSGRMPDSQSRKPGFESPFAIILKFGYFRLRLQSAQLYCINEYLTVDGGGNMSE